MKLALDFHSAVRGEIVDAKRWYEKQRRGLGSEFLDAIEATLQLIVTAPARF